jgi:outer membrane protein insertion porin family
MLMQVGTVDIEYQLVEKDRELNFKEVMVVVSLVRLGFRSTTFRPNMFNKDAYRPYRWEMVKKSLRLQEASTQTYSVSFSEPWFGGKNQYHLVHHCLVNNF